MRIHATCIDHVVLNVSDLDTSRRWWSTLIGARATKDHEGEVSFKVVRKGRNNNEITSNYTGKVDGDVLKGKVETNFNGTPRSREFEAKRAKD